MYQEPEKIEARNLLLRHAVRVLTKDRESSRILREESVRKVAFDAALYLKQYGKNKIRDGVLEATQVRLDNWGSLIQSHHQPKEASELRVLYLCGPSPENDLEVFLDCGVLPENIWAIESKDSHYRVALERVKERGSGIRLHQGELAEFFRQVPTVFDIVYLDVCGRFMGGRPNTLGPLLEALTHQRLAPLSALITNYSEVKPDALEQYAALTSAYFMARYRSVPKALWESGLDPVQLAYEGEPLRRICKENIEPFYSDFITRFSVDIARYIIPSCRALSINSVFESVFSISLSKLKDTLDLIFGPENGPPPDTPFQKWVIKSLERQTWDIVPDSYPLYVFFY